MSESGIICRVLKTHMRSIKEKGTMKVEIKVPDMGDEEITEATVSFWYYDEGEKVSEGEDLVELLTDKATFNVAAPASGVLLRVGAGEGETVRPAQVIGYLETEG